MDNEKPSSEKNHPNAPGAGAGENAGDAKLIVVGVGASAGGLEAFTDLLKSLPSRTGMAIVLVQHLDPHHESALSEILAAKTSIPVLQVHNQTRIEPDHIYVIPPNTMMRVRDRTLVLESRPKTTDRFNPIDAFFSSLAREFRFNAVGVVLSGTASDGTIGLKAIKAEGGITFAQNQTAKFDSMPRSAIAAGAVDFVLAPRRIAEELASIAQRTHHLKAGEYLDAGATLQRILMLLRNQTGVDFSQYKSPTIQRRLGRRMVVRRTESLEQYYELLRQDPQEVTAVFEDLLINVTDFFRDPDVFESAKRVAFPSMLRDRKSPHSVRVWIPGCSSGEEVYSMAIALTEFLESEDLDYNIQMFGTDISEGTINKARAAIYDESSVASVSPERLRRFFVRVESGYQISRAIREMCIFSRHNVAKDPPLSRMDLISCRNLLIYFTPALQRRIIATFGYALQPSGCLILGPSETLGDLSQYFVTIDESHKIYCRKPDVSPAVFTIAQDPEYYEPSRYAAPPPPPEPVSPSLHRYVNTIVLSRFGPAGVVVNERLKIIEYRGNMSRYLVEPENQPDADLLNVIRPELRSAVSTAVEQARRTNSAVVADKISGSTADRSVMLTITVVPLALAGLPQHFLLLFGRTREEAAQPEAAREAAEVNAPTTAEQQNIQLQQELRATREYLQSVIEELRSTNEEVQSANEELQSTNEEMQTSREELQSSNEELNTINAELQSRNADLARLNDDLINLLGSMNMPIVMTGPDLRIRRFTPTAEKALRLISTDTGRPIADLNPRINVGNLEQVLQRVLDTLQPYEQEVQDQDGRFYLMRARPYRTADNRIDGTVMQLLDVSDLKRSMEAVRHARDYAEAIVNTVREPLVVLDQNLAIQDANPAFYEALGLTPAVLNQSIYEIAGRRFDLPQVRKVFEQLNTGSPQVSDIEIELRIERGEPQIFSLNGRRLSTPERQHLILMALQDVTERKQTAEARYRRLFESARDGIVLVSAETWVIMDVNPFSEKLLGYSRDELVGRTLWDINLIQGRSRVQTAFAQIQERGALRLDDITMRTKDAHELQTEVIASVYPEGDRYAIQLNIRDVSERKKFERELQETQKLESLGLLAGGIAHDFNNLLTGIIGYASLAYSEVPANHPLRTRLREIVRAGERASFLTRQMLAYAGKGAFVTERIDLGDLVREILALLQASIPKSIELNLDLAPDLPPIAADPAQIQQVVMNLVINAAEAIGESGSGEVAIRACVRELSQRDAAEFVVEDAPPGTYVEINVSDTGSGMDESTQTRIFDPFFTTKFTGRGLGLAAVQGIIKGHRGAIRVRSTPGRGTTFVILLPAAPNEPAANGPEPPQVFSIPAGAVALVIDDEEIVRTLVDSALSHAGMKVLTAGNGKAGIDMFREHHSTLSVVILDLLMPGMGGEEALARLKRIDQNVPMILSSGFSEREAARRFSDPRPSGFLQKPYTAEQIVAAVANALQRTKGSGRR